MMKRMLTGLAMAAVLGAAASPALAMLNTGASAPDFTAPATLGGTSSPSTSPTP